MDFSFSDEQVQVADSVERYLAKNYTFEHRRAIARHGGRSSAIWQQLAEMGVAGLGVPEEHGGMGSDLGFLVPVAQVFGRTLCLEPFYTSTVAAGTALRLAADQLTASELLPALATGEKLVGYAHVEAEAGADPFWVTTTARSEGSEWLLEGRKIHVLHGDAADHSIVTARLGEAGPLALFLVDRQAPRLEIRNLRLIDDTPASELVFSATPAKPLGDPQEPGRAQQVMETTRRVTLAALCADAFGVMERAYELTIEYLKVRQQFGRPIGENQALRHRAAEMLCSLEAGRAMMMVVATALDDIDSDGAGLDILRAKLVLTQQGKSLCQSAIQLHGAIGMTEEHVVGHCLRRMTVFEQLFGDVATCSGQLAALLAAQDSQLAA